MILQKLIYRKKIIGDKFFGLMRLKLICLDLMDEFMLEEKGVIDCDILRQYELIHKPIIK
ncbi:hypothetical protein HERIO_2245 [Hepatospora eriocheir]|uniref:Uncharacterized protein n=1 Tax=Hepatospora eriocheir TaxID=1081669 RepID=A0A1X0Q7P9_9MICR|nr:hypothetical protein HERIO_2245 [Hepatospora eriocheir]